MMIAKARPFLTIPKLKRLDDHVPVFMAAQMPVIKSAITKMRNHQTRGATDCKVVL